MGGLLTSISGKFATMAVLGTMFPVLFVSGLNLILVTPVLPLDSTWQNRLMSIAVGDASWRLVALTFVVLVLTGLLYNLNIPIIRLYEGYPWENSCVGRLCARRWKRRLSRAVDLRESVRGLRRQLSRNQPAHALVDPLWEAETKLAVLLNHGLPDREDLVLPTKLGNLIRSFERYPEVAYGMDAIALWPRLVAKLDSPFASTVDDAKTTFDFMINCSFLSALTAILVIVLMLRDSSALLTPESLAWGWRAGVFIVLAVIFYRWAIGAAEQWGAQVRAAFDVYRFDLLKALGYEQRPSSLAEERPLWDSISSRLLFADWQSSVPPYKAPPTRIIVSPPEVQLTATRTLHQHLHGIVEVVLTVENKDPSRFDAYDVEVIDAIPDGYRYVIGSLESTAGIAVENLTPLDLRLGRIASDRGITVRYRIRSSAST